MLPPCLCNIDFVESTYIVPDVFDESQYICCSNIVSPSSVLYNFPAPSPFYPALKFTHFTGGGGCGGGGRSSMRSGGGIGGGGSGRC